jgi:acyl-coenzyme A synthetase/AMP-(fatty) acid ligase
MSRSRSTTTRRANRCYAAKCGYAGRTTSPSSFFGEEVAAAFRLRPGASATADELRTFVKMFVEAFPLTGSGKLQRFKLREEFLGSPR